MKTVFCCALLVLAAACATTKSDDAETSAAPSAAMNAQQTAALETRVTDMQTSMTELLERLDVMNSRIAKLESGAPVTADSVGGQRPGEAIALPHVMPINPAAQQPTAQPSAALVGAQLADTYRRALMLYGRGKVDDARRTFQQVFDQDPTGDLADNALFWIGETYFAAGNYVEASKYYKRVTIEFAEQNKAPDALFKIALGFEKSGDLGLARQTLEEVIRRYPYSSPAASAKLELKRIKY
jgi:tol-pal system protein YbgF